MTTNVEPDLEPVVQAAHRSAPLTVNTQYVESELTFVMLLAASADLGLSTDYRYRFGANLFRLPEQHQFLSILVPYLACLAVHSYNPCAFIQVSRISSEVNPFAAAGSIRTFSNKTSHLLGVWCLRLCKQRRYGSSGDNSEHQNESDQYLLLHLVNPLGISSWGGERQV